VYGNITIETGLVQSVPVEASMKESNTPMTESVGGPVEGEISMSEVTDDDNVTDDGDIDFNEEMDMDD
jgi:hypothetical protein